MGFGSLDPTLGQVIGEVHMGRLLRCSRRASAK